MSITSFVKRIQDITRNDAGVNGDAQRIEQMSWLLFKLGSCSKWGTGID
ncbi:SAM-dependent DNA methyltransferase, partial [Streptococcus pneumoniae]